MSQTGNDNGYVIARNALIDALLALRPHLQASYILVGAHAVYLRAPEHLSGVPLFTLDGDILADPRRIGRARDIRERLERVGFALRGRHAGLYYLANLPPDQQYAGRVDVLVPSAFAHLWNPETYDASDATATFVQPGLELALFDHSPLTVSSIDPERGPRSITVPVAGSVALIIAKGWKIGDRFALGMEAFREVGKDLTDLYRLLRAARAEDLKAAFESLPRDEMILRVASQGASYLGDLCKQDGPGVELIKETLGNGREAELIGASLPLLVAEFCELADECL